MIIYSKMLVFGFCSLILQDNPHIAVQSRISKIFEMIINVLSSIDNPEEDKIGGKEK